MTSEAQIEQEIQAKGLNAPRITPADLDEAIVSSHYFTAADGVNGSFIQSATGYAPPEPLGLLTFCVLVLKNGFTVNGFSVPASPENFDAEIGRKVAYNDAREKLWPLLGYELKCRLAREAQLHKDFKEHGGIVTNNGERVDPMSIRLVPADTGTVVDTFDQPKEGGAA